MALFAGGGAVFGLTNACAAVVPGGVGPGGSVPVGLRYAPSELNRLPSELTLFWPDGSETLELWGAMTPSTSFFGAAGRQILSQFTFYPTRPQMRVVQRQISAPAGADLARARELVLRMEVQNFASAPGCNATIAGTLRRE